MFFLSPTNTLIAAFAVLAVFLFGFFAGSFSSSPFGLNFLPSNDEPAVLNPLPASAKLEASTNIAAVDGSGNGILNKAEVEIIDGKGRVLFNTNPFVEPDTQLSLETAAKVAFDYTNTDMSDKDVIFSVSDTPAQLIGGPSAGAAFTVATIAAIEGKQVKEGVAMTGTIDERGRIGPIGGVFEKAKAAGGQGLKLFLVPDGQSELVFYKQVVRERKRGFFTIRSVDFVPEKLDLKEYAMENFSLEIKEVSNIEEAVKEMIE